MYSFYNSFHCVISGSKERPGTIKLEACQTYDLLVRYTDQAIDLGTTIVTARGGLRFGVSPTKSIGEFIDEAVAVANEVDVVILLVGLNSGTHKLVIVALGLSPEIRFHDRFRVRVI